MYGQANRARVGTLDVGGEQPGSPRRNVVQPQSSNSSSALSAKTEFQPTKPRRLKPLSASQAQAATAAGSPTHVRQPHAPSGSAPAKRFNRHAKRESNLAARSAASAATAERSVPSAQPLHVAAASTTRKENKFDPSPRAKVHEDKIKLSDPLMQRKFNRVSVASGLAAEQRHRAAVLALVLQQGVVCDRNQLTSRGTIHRQPTGRNFDFDVSRVVESNASSLEKDYMSPTASSTARACSTPRAPSFKPADLRGSASARLVASAAATAPELKLNGAVLHAHSVADVKRSAAGAYTLHFLNSARTKVRPFVASAQQMIGTPAAKTDVVAAASSYTASTSSSASAAKKHVGKDMHKFLGMDTPTGSALNPLKAGQNAAAANNFTSLVFK